MSKYLKLLSLHQKDGMVINSHHLQPGSDFTETLEYIHTVGTYKVIVDCSLSTVMKFLDKALEMQMLTSKYHYHFTSLVSSTLVGNCFTSLYVCGLQLIKGTALYSIAFKLFYLCYAAPYLIVACMPNVTIT